MLCTTRHSVLERSSHAVAYGLFACVLLTTSPIHVSAQDRSAQDTLEWIDNTGKHRVEAQFVRIDGEQVVLKRADGKEIKIPFDRLNKESLAQAKTFASAVSKGTKAIPSTSSKSSSSPDTSSSNSSPVTIPDNLDAKAFVDLIMVEVQKKNATIFWDALPAEKQAELESMVELLAKKLDSRTFDMVRKTRNSVIEIAKKQQQFILNSPLIPIPPDQKSVIENSYPAIVGMIDSYVSKDLFDSKRLQKGDLRTLIENWTKNIAASAEELGKSLPDGHPIRAQMLDYSGLEYTVESISSTEADVKIMVPGPDGTPQEVVWRLKLTEGRWLPKEMVESWDGGMAQAKAAVEMINGEQVHQAVSSVLFVLNAPLNNLKNAKTQEAFDQTLQEVMATAQGFAMNSMGGGGPGGPGGPPRGGIPPQGAPFPGKPGAGAGAGAGAESAPPP